MASAVNSCKREGRQRRLKQRQHKGRQQSPKSGSNSSRNGAGDGRDGGRCSSGSGNGDGDNGGDNTAAMAAVTAAPTLRQQWQRGRPMWAEVIFRTYYYLHNSRVRTDVITIVRRMTKHKIVLWQNTTFKTLLKSVLPKQKVF